MEEANNVTPAADASAEPSNTPALTMVASPLASAVEAPKAEEATKPQAESKAATSRPEYVPDKFWNADTGEVRLEDVFKSYSNLESLKGGAKDVVRLPGANATPEEVAEFRAKMGVPDAPDKYEIILPEGIKADPRQVDWLKGISHKAGISNEAANVIAKEYATTLVQGFNEIAQQTETELRKEWGTSYDKNIRGVYNALVQFGGKETADRFANSQAGIDAGFIKAIHNFTRQFAEDTIRDSAGSAFNVVNAEARIKEIMYDKTSKDFVAFYNGNDPRHKDVMSEVRRLQEEIYKAKAQNTGF
jgi:hypothetical protein